MFYFFIGFMGAGKSLLAQQIADAKGWQFIDIDAYIEKMTNMSISKLFEEKGESLFRQIEADCLRNIVNENGFYPPLTAMPPYLIACGGGTPLFFDNHNFMKAIGISIYLKVSPKILAARLQKEKDKRPLLKHLSDDALLPFIEMKLAERATEYEKADIIIENNHQIQAFFQHELAI